MPNKPVTKTTNLKKIAMVLLCLVITACIILVIGVNYDKRTKDNIATDFYYMNHDSSGMQSETKQIANGTEMEILAEVLKNLKAGSNNEGLVGSIPADILFLSIDIQDGIVTIDTGPQYKDMSAGVEMICRASIVWTFTSLPFVEYVEITVEGVPLTKTDGTEIGKMNRENVVIDTVVSPETTRYEDFLLYFASADGTALAPEKREIEVSQNQPKERSVVEQLIAGPKGKTFLATIPPETKLRDITTTDDGICYVNFSSEFVNKKNVGSETLAVYSVVNSLVGLTYIDKVQFLIEGEKLEKYKEAIDISKPLAARPSLVKE